jgi:hypothetical protein
MEAPTPHKGAMSPIVRHMLIGLGVALVFLLCVGAMVLASYARVKFSGDLSGAGGVIGFMLLPLVALVGAPWSLLLMDSHHLFVTGVVLGPLINGAMLGTLSGCLTSYRKDKAQRGA